MQDDGAEQSDAPLPEPRGTESAEQMVRDNIGWMLALARRVLGDPALAEDAVQDAFQNAFRALDGFQERSSLETWLHRITVNASLTILRRQKRRAEEPIDDYLPEFDQHGCRIEAHWPLLAGVEEIMNSQRLRSLVEREMDALPDAYRIVLQLRDIEEYNTREVAALLGISESNVKVRLHRARSALKKRLEPILRGEIS